MSVVTTVKIYHCVNGDGVNNGRCTQSAHYSDNNSGNNRDGLINVSWTDLEHMTLHLKVQLLPGSIWPYRRNIG